MWRTNLWRCAINLDPPRFIPGLMLLQLASVSLSSFWCLQQRLLWRSSKENLAARAPKKNTSHGNEVVPQNTTHFIQSPCYQRGSPCQDSAGNRTTRRPPDHRKEDVGRQHQGMDRAGVCQVPEGSEEQGRMEKTGIEIICGAPTTLAVKGLMRWDDDGEQGLTSFKVSILYKSTVPPSLL